MTALPSIPGTPGHVTSRRPTALRSPDGLTIIDFAQIDNWSDVVRVLSDNTTLRIHVLQAARSSDGRLKAYAAMLLHDAMATAMQVTLDDSDTADLAEELDAARQEPDECHYCDRAGVVVVEGVPMCSLHAKALDHSQLVGGEG